MNSNLHIPSPVSHDINQNVLITNCGLNQHAFRFTQRANIHAYAHFQSNAVQPRMWGTITSILLCISVACRSIIKCAAIIDTSNPSSPAVRGQELNNVFSSRTSCHCLHVFSPLYPWGGTSCVVSHSTGTWKRLCLPAVKPKVKTRNPECLGSAFSDGTELKGALSQPGALARELMSLQSLNHLQASMPWQHSTWSRAAGGLGLPFDESVYRKIMFYHQRSSFVR